MRIYYNDAHVVEGVAFGSEILSNLRCKRYMEANWLPMQEPQKGKVAVLMCDGERCWYNYEEPQPAPEALTDRMRRLEEDLLASQLAAAEEFEAKLKVENELLTTQKGIAELFEMVMNKEA